MNIDSTASAVSSGGGTPKGAAAAALAAIKKLDTGNADANKALSSLVTLLEDKSANPNLLEKLSSFLLDGSGDPVPIEREKHPVFYHATKNEDMYHFVPKKGVGVQKDGHKLHFFDYEASFHNRSKDFYGEEIDAAIKIIEQGREIDDKLEEDMNDQEKKAKEEGEKMRHRLSNLLVAAYTDLVMDGNSDMTSYMYLMDKATSALSKEVKKELKDLSNDGGVALALVTELVATSSSAQGLFARAVLSRELMDNLEGLEGINESYVRKAYAAITPMVETKGILLNNGVDISEGWGKELATAAPSFNQLVGMDFGAFKQIVPSSSVGPEAPVSDISDLRAPSGQELIAYQMYAGLIAPPSSHVAVPPIRGYVLENGLNPQVAHEMEKLGHTDLTAVDDKDIYNAATDVLANIGTDFEPGDPGKVKQRDRERDAFMKRKIMDVHQSSVKDKVNGVQPQKRWKSAFGRVSSANRTVGALKGGVRVAAGSALAKGVTAGAATAGAGAVGTGAGMAGMAATAASGLAAIAGPLAVAVALAPVIKDLASSTEMAMDKDMDAAISEREKIAAEVEDLLHKVRTNPEGNLKELEDTAKDLLDRVRNPTALALSQTQGMGLQKQLHALETRFSPTNMASLVPYTSNEELVAGVDSGKALKAVSIFVDPTEKITTPQRQMLQTPRYVNLMGPSVPFRTFTRRTTSENEARSFASSISHIGLSTASKTVSSSSRSTNVGTNIIVAGAKAKQSSATTGTGENNEQDVDSEEYKEEENKKAHQAIVSEFTVMPMQTFRLREGGLSLTPYAYYRLQRITNGIDFDGKDIDSEPDKTGEQKEMKKEIVSRQKAREFIRNFGSHIPFGVQTLGGIFVRTMKITSKKKTSLSELYSMAASRLTTTNEEATMTNTTATGRYGILGLGPSLTSSTGFSKARASGETKDTKEAEGVGRGTTSMASTFESDVTCFGPNAATQDDLYQQLMANNRTWTVIDRGEPDSYFAIWDFIDYLGQGKLFERERKLLKEAWEEMALPNSVSNISIRDSSNVLMSSLMRYYEVKKKMFNFVHALIYCLVPKTGYEYDLSLAKNFKQFIVRGRDALSEGDIFDLKALIEEATKERATRTPSTTSSGQGMVETGQPASKMLKTATKLELKFDLVDGNEGYQLATEIMKEIPSIDWENHFSYYTDTFTRAILEKGKPSFLYDVCTVCRFSTDEKNWKLFDEIVKSFNHEENDKSKSILHKYLNHRDEESGNYCLHLVVESNILDRVRKVHGINRSIAFIKNKENKTPKEIAEKYPNVKRFDFPPSEDDIQNARIAHVWAIDDKNRVHFRNENEEWKRISDVEIRQISTSDNGNHVWGVGPYGQVYYLRRSLSSQWKTVECKKGIIMDNIAVSANGEHVWAIDIDGIVYRGVKGEEQWDFDPENTVFKLKSISVNQDGSKVYGIDHSGDCVLRKSDGWVNYGERGKSLKRISISPDGELLWFTDFNGCVYRCEEERLCLVSTTPELRHVVVHNDANAWGITRNGDVLRYAESQWSSVKHENYLFKQISACDTSRTTPAPTKKKDSFVYLKILSSVPVIGPATVKRTEQDLKDYTISVFQHCHNKNNESFTTNELSIQRILDVFDARTTLSEKFFEVSSSHSKLYPVPDGITIDDYETVYDIKFRDTASERIGAVDGDSDVTYIVNSGEAMIEYVPIKVVCFTVNGGARQFARIPLDEPVVRPYSVNRLSSFADGGFLLDSKSWRDMNQHSGTIELTNVDEAMEEMEPINIEAPIMPGKYRIKTVQHQLSGCPAEQGLDVHLKRTHNSYWVGCNNYDDLQCQWEVKTGDINGTFQILSTVPFGTIHTPSGWELSVVPLNEADTDEKARVCITTNDYKSSSTARKSWKIAPGKTPGTWRILTTNDYNTGQAAGWGLGPKLRSGESSFGLDLHRGDVWPMDWKFEKRGVPFGTYKIKTTHRGWDGCKAGRGLFAMRNPSDGVRSSDSTWVGVHDGGDWPCLWEILPGSEPDTFRIETKAHQKTEHEAHWGLISFPNVSTNGKRDQYSYQVAAVKGQVWKMNWKIVPGRIAGTWRILTTENAPNLGGQQADWGLAAWGGEFDTQRNPSSSWVYVTGGRETGNEFYFMDWILEKQD